MKSLKPFLIATLLIFSLSCTDEQSSEQTEELRELENQLAEIVAMAESVPCSNAAEWTFTSYGSKACGGPVGYIAYATTINTELFLQKIGEYTEAQEAFNSKWNIGSDCSVPSTPTGVSCENQKTVLIYD